MISRVADSIYWMSRYLERAENIARFIDVNLHLTLDLRFEVVSDQWLSLVSTSGDSKDFEKRYKTSSEEDIIYFLTFDRKNPNSIASCISAARENARSIRDTISSEMWEQINRFYLLIQKNNKMNKIKNLQEFFYQIKMANHLFIGLTESTMSHEEAWHFAQLGKFIERADKTARILDVKYYLLLPNSEFINSSYDAVQWAALLKSTSAFEMYRKKFHKISYKNVADFLILDPSFPRSIHHCVLQALTSIRAISRYTKTESPALTDLASLHQVLCHDDIHNILETGLHEFIDKFQIKLNEIDQEIKTSFIETSPTIPKNESDDGEENILKKQTES
tara:strand:+ start:1393 stop:2397 length:1005 start_codon:yes stop_codon:yes gene_type:complete